MNLRGVVAAGGALACAGVIAVAGVLGGQNHYALDEEWTDSAISSQWTLLNRQGDTGNSEAQCYQPSNAATASGVLQITTKVQSVTCNGTAYSYTSAFLQSAFTFTYGTVSARIMMPGGAGPWPTFWLLGANCQQTNITTANNTGTCNWPQPGSDEVDIAEILSSSTTSVNEQIHTFGSGAAQNPGCTATTTNTSTNWHTYSLVWRPGHMEWFIDGVSQCVVTSFVPTTPMFIILNDAIGGVGGTITNGTLPVTMQVDWVRVTQP